MNQNKPKPQHRAHVASLTPGRLRIKMHPQHRDEATLQVIQTDLQAQEGVQEVKVNPANGSLTMQFDRGRYTPKGIMGLLEDVDVLVESIGQASKLEGVVPVQGEPSPSFIFAVEDLNRRIQSMTGLPVDLKLVLPLTFVGAGAWSIARRGLMIESVPGWLFLWFAFDMFVKLHPVRQVKSEAIEPKWL